MKRSPLSFENLAILLLALLAFVFVFAYGALSPVVLASLIVGLFLSLVVENREQAVLSGSLVGLLGSFIATQLFSLNSYQYFVKSMPMYANPDVVGYVYEQTLFGLMLRNPLNSSFATSSRSLLLILLSTLLTTLFAFLSFYFLDISETKDRIRVFVAYVVIALLSLNFLYTAATISSPLLPQIGSEPPDLTYSYDAVMNLKTYYLMLRGTSFYDAFTKAASKDIRLNQEHAVRGGKFYAFVNSPIYFRQPYLFYFWKLIAPINAINIFWASLLLCIFIFFLSFSSFLPYLSYKALFVPIFSFPLFLISTVWHNLLFPDWWASLMIVLSFLFLFRKNLWLCGLFAFLAALFRETFIVGLLLFAAISLILYIRNRKWNQVVAFLPFLLLFFFLYALHYARASNYVVSSTSGLNLLISSIQRDMGIKFLAPVCYMMFPYGFFKFPPFLFLIFALIGFNTIFKKEPLMRAATMTYILFWTIFFLVVGASSSYWGQVLMPLVVIGTGSSLASLPMFITQLQKSPDAND